MSNGESDRYVSYMGAFLSFLMLSVTAVFAYDKVLVLINASDVTVQVNTRDFAFTHDEKFTAEEGFFIAAALTEYDSNREVIEEARYGELIIEHYGWGCSDNGIVANDCSKALEYHYCSDEELGFTPGPDTLIYPIIETSVNEVETWKKKFKCIKKEELVIWGDYNSAKAQQINI